MALARSYTAGVSEMADGLRSWRIWHLLGTADLRRRHARSRGGQLWLTLSTAIMILALGLVWSLLWRIPVNGILPYIGVAIIFWGLITGILNEATTAFTSISNLFVNQRTSLSVAIFALCYRNLIMLAYNLVIIVALFAWFGIWPTWQFFLVIPGLILTLVFLLSAAYVLAIVGTRFRDTVPLTMSITQVAYFITPVLWKPDFLPEDYRWINLVNPFSVFLSILRDPILGNPLSPATWGVAFAYTVVAALLALPFVGYYRKRVIYWI
jgi:ABC-type polysaccharide/polyol phosphate export permease